MITIKLVFTAFVLNLVLLSLLKVTEEYLKYITSQQALMLANLELFALNFVTISIPVLFLITLVILTVMAYINYNNTHPKIS